MNSSRPVDPTTEIVQLIKRRQTFKVLGNVEDPVKISRELATKYDSIVLESIKTAGWAPFHYDRSADGIAEPWRVHVLWHDECRKIANNLGAWFDDVKPSNKLPAMLAACGALVIVNWIPQFKPGFGAKSELELVPKDKQVAIDEEHLAASAAMVQNLLLILTSHSMGTYWSSGGQFRTPEMFKRLGISQQESFLAGVFIEYPGTGDEQVERLPGKQRTNRSAASRWLREVRLD